MQASRRRLPAAKQASEVVETVKQNQVTLVLGETGCGKTTQVPQFILDDFVKNGQGGNCTIVCTQPRRLAATGVAQRVADEQDVALGDLVGYQIRLDTKASKHTRLLFCTTGILLRRLHGDALTGVSHVIVDEVHERDVDTDFLLAILRDVAAKRPDIKIILMSATMDPSIFVRYFGQGKIIKIPGFTYPVEEFYVEDVLEATHYVPQASKGWRKAEATTGGLRPFSTDGLEGIYSDDTLDSIRRLAHSKRLDYGLVASAVLHADAEGLRVRDDGAILVFMSGTAEISRAIEAIKRLARDAGRIDALQIIPLHGSLTSKDQARIFKSPPKGIRKIVVSTNVAETSITINDCSFVIDSGRMKETRYNPASRMSMLVEDWISLASARQRRGRAGRVRNGRCFRLWTKSAMSRLDPSQSPEIMRVPLERLCLMVRLLGLGKPMKVLSNMIEPPPRESIKSAVQHLRKLKAFTGQSELTPLGNHLARMPVDAQIGKMLIYGSLLRCTEDVLTIAASLTTRSPFLSPLEKRNEANDAKCKLAGNSRSDLIALLNAYNGWSASKRKSHFCEANFLSYDGMRTINDLRRQLATALVDSGFRSRNERASASLSRDNSVKSSNVLRAALCAGLYPNVIEIKKPPKRYEEGLHGSVVKVPEARELKFFTLAEEDDSSSADATRVSRERVFRHPSSVNFKQRDFPSPWMVFFQKVRTSKIFIRDATMIPPVALLLFGGDVEVMHQRNKIVVDGWMYFDAPARVGVLIRELRRELDALLERKIENPLLDIGASPLIDAMMAMLQSSGY